MRAAPVSASTACVVATVDLHAASRSDRQIVFATSLATGGPHTIEIRPLGDGRVDVDAFVVLGLIRLDAAQRVDGRRRGVDR